MRALITGATGLLGKRLVERLLSQGASVVVLSREPEKARRALGDVEAHAWQPEAGPAPDAAFRTRDGRAIEIVFHLAGDPVADGRWTDAKKRHIRDSRELGTRNLVSAIEELTARPRVLISASAVGLYGNRGDEILEESAAPASDFLAEVCVAWERESQRAAGLGLRVANPRIGVVLAKEGGALATMLKPFRFGAGGQLGDGRQWMPWIHVDDMVGLLLHAATTDAVSGPMNATAPAPVTNGEFTRALAHAVHRPALLHVPAFALRLGFGELGGMMLASQRAIPKVAESTGYHFLHPQLDEALASALAQ